MAVAVAVADTNMGAVDVGNAAATVDVGNAAATVDVGAAG